MADTAVKYSLGAVAGAAEKMRGCGAAIPTIAYLRERHGCSPMKIDEPS